MLPVAKEVLAFDALGIELASRAGDAKRELRRDSPPNRACERRKDRRAPYQARQRLIEEVASVKGVCDSAEGATHQHQGVNPLLMAVIELQRHLNAHRMGRHNG